MQIVHRSRIRLNLSSSQCAAKHPASILSTDELKSAEKREEKEHVSLYQPPILWPRKLIFWGRWSPGKRKRKNAHYHKTFSQNFQEKCIIEVVRIGSTIIFHLRKLFLVRLLGVKGLVHCIYMSRRFSEIMNRCSNVFVGYQYKYTLFLCCLGKVPKCPGLILMCRVIKFQESCLNIELSTKFARVPSTDAWSAESTQAISWDGRPSACFATAHCICYSETKQVPHGINTKGQLAQNIDSSVYVSNAPASNFDQLLTTPLGWWRSRQKEIKKQELILFRVIHSKTKLENTIPSVDGNRPHKWTGIRPSCRGSLTAKPTIDTTVSGCRHSLFPIQLLFPTDIFIGSELLNVTRFATSFTREDRISVPTHKIILPYYFNWRAMTKSTELLPRVSKLKGNWGTGEGEGTCLLRWPL